MTMKDRVKELRRVPASELRANPKNWRRHPPAQEAALRGVLEDIGFADAVIARETPNGLELIDGHLRQEVMGDQPVPVLIVDVTEEEADKMLLTYDPLAMMAHADQDQLLNLLRDTQFESKAVNDMLEAVANGERLPMPDLHEPVDDPGPEIDRADELREKWQTERGQVWEAGRHRLMCGDCTAEKDVGILMDAEQIDCIVTDPPYGVDYDGGTKVRDKLVGDTSPSLYGPALSSWRPHCKANVALYLWYADGDQAVAQAVAQAGFHVRRNLIWNKQLAQYGALSQQYKQKHEPFFYCHLKGQSPFWAGDAAEVTVWDVDRASINEFHPTQKPPELFQRAIKNSTRFGGIVLDGFLGSGTTMVAAEQLGRICYGMEIEPKYVAVALERMAGMGFEPKLVTG